MILFEEIKKLPKLKCMFVIIVSYLVLLVLFEPFYKVDDLYMNDIMVGTYSGHTDCHYIYGNILVGIFVSTMTDYFPKIPWYALLQIVFCICSIYLLSVFFIKKSISIIKLIPYIVYFEYILMIKITFTQTAGICFTFGIIYLLLYITDDKKCYAIWGMIGMIQGMIFRNVLLNASLAFFIISILAIMYLEFINNGHRINIDNYKNIILKTVIILILLFSISKILSLINTYYYDTDTTWNSYYQDNRIKSAFTDYDIKSYSDNREEYLAISCSENDLKMIRSNNLYYKNVYSDPWMLQIYDYAKTYKNDKAIIMLKMINLDNFFRFSKVFYNNNISYSFVIVIMLAIITLFVEHGKKNTIIAIIGLLFTYFIESYFLYVYGRGFQTHVDLHLSTLCGMLICFIILQYSNYRLEKEDNTKKRICEGIVIIYIVVSVNLWGKYYDYGDATAANPQYSKDVINYIQNDSEHIYITTSKESVFSLWDTYALQGNLTGTKDNIFFMGQYMWPSCREVLRKYKVVNPLEEIVDSNLIRFFVSDAIEEEQVDMIETYCQEHVDSKSCMVKIDEYKTLNIYECRTN